MLNSEFPNSNFLISQLSRLISRRRAVSLQ